MLRHSAHRSSQTFVLSVTPSTIERDRNIVPVNITSILIIGISLCLTMTTGLIARLPLETGIRLTGLVLFSIGLGTWFSKRFASGNSKSFAMRLFLSAFGVRIFTGLLLGMYLLNTQASLPFQDDALLFHNQAVSIASAGGPWHLSREQLRQFSGPSLVYASLYSVLRDDSAFLSLVLNIFLGALTPVVGWRLAQETGLSEKIARRAGWLMAFLPGTIIYSSTHMKEGPIALAVTFLLYLVITKSTRSSLLTGLLSLPALILVFWYRDRLGWVLLVFFIIGMTIVNKKGAFWRAFSLKGLFLACIVAFLVLRIGLILRETDQNIFERVFLYDWYVAQQPVESVLSPLSFVSGSQVDSLRMAAFLPVGAVYLLILPLPWFVLKEGMYFQTRLLSLANIGWLLLLPLYLLGCFYLWKGPHRWQRTLVLLSIGGALMMAFSLGVLATFGRHREIPMPFMLIITAAGWEHFRLWRQPDKLGMIAVAMLSFAAISALYLWNEGWLSLQMLMLIAMLPSSVLMGRILLPRWRMWA